MLRHIHIIMVHYVHKPFFKLLHSYKLSGWQIFRILIDLYTTVKKTQRYIFSYVCTCALRLTLCASSTESFVTTTLANGPSILWILELKDWVWTISAMASNLSWLVSGVSTTIYWPVVLIPGAARITRRVCTTAARRRTNIRTWIWLVRNCIFSITIHCVNLSS